MEVVALPLFPAGSKTDQTACFFSHTESKRAAGGWDKTVPSSLTLSLSLSHTLTRTMTQALSLTQINTHGK